MTTGCCHSQRRPWARGRHHPAQLTLQPLQCHDNSSTSWQDAAAGRRNTRCRRQVGAVVLWRCGHAYPLLVRHGRRLCHRCCRGRGRPTGRRLSALGAEAARRRLQRQRLPAAQLLPVGVRLCHGYESLLLSPGAPAQVMSLSEHLLGPPGLSPHHRTRWRQQDFLKLVCIHMHKRTT